MADRINAPELVTELVLDTVNFEKGAARAGARLGDFVLLFKDVQSELRNIGNTAMGLGAALGVGMAPGIVNAQRLELAMSRVYSMADATEAEARELRRAVMQLGTSAVGPRDLAMGMEDLASAGLSVNEVIETLPVSMRLAIATQRSMADTSELLVQAIRSFRLETDQAARVANLIAAADAEGSLSAERLADAYQYVGSSASSMGISIEEATAAIGVITEVTQNGERAGTSLRSILATLASEALPELEEAARRAGISLRDLDPAQVGIAETARNLQKILDTGTSAYHLFDRVAADSAITLAANADEIERFTAAITGTNAAGTMFQRQMTTTIRKLDQLRNTITTTGISYAQGLKPFLDAAIASLQVFVEIMNAIPQPVKTVIGVIVSLGSVWLLLGGLIARVTAELYKQAAAERTLNGIRAMSYRVAGGVGEMWRTLVGHMEAHRSALIAQAAAQQRYAAVYQRTATVIATAANSSAAAQARAARLAAEQHLIAARMHTVAAGQTAAAYAREKGSALGLTAAMIGLRQAYLTLMRAMSRFWGIVRIVAFNKLTLIIIGVGLALREMAKYADIMQVAVKSANDTLGDFRQFFEDLIPLLNVVGKLLSSLAIGAVATLAAGVNILTRSFALMAANMKLTRDLADPRNWTRLGEVFEEYGDRVEEINDRFAETSRAIEAVAAAEFSELWSDAVDEATATAAAVGMTAEELALARLALGEFVTAWGEAADDLIFEVNATPLERQLRSVTDTVKGQIEELDAFAQENPIVYELDIDGNLLEEGVASAYETLKARFEDAADEARDLILGNFIGTLQRRVDDEWIASLDEGTDKIQAEYRQRNAALEQEYQDALRAAEGNATALAEIEREFTNLRLLNRMRRDREIAELDEEIAQRVVNAERELIQAQIDSMEDGEAKIRAASAQRVNTIRRSTQDELEGIEEGSDAYVRLKAIEAELVALANREMQRELDDHNAEVQARLDESLRTYQRTIAALQQETERLQTEGTQDPFANLLRGQREEIRSAYDEVSRAIEQVQEDLRDGIIDTAEAAARSAGILAAWADQEQALRQSHNRAQRELIAEREADEVRHQQRLRELWDEAASFSPTAEGASREERIAADRDASLRALEAWHAEQQLREQGNADELVRITEEYEARRAAIYARAESERRAALQESLAEQVDVARQLAATVAQEGAGGVVNADELQLSAERLRVVREELAALGATEATLAPLNEALGATNAELSALAAQGRDELASALATVRGEITALTDDLAGGVSDEVALERRLAGYQEELEAHRSALRLRLGDTEEYHRAVARLEAEYADREELLREQHRRAQRQAYREERENVAEHLREIRSDRDRARAELIEDEAEQLRAVARIERAERRRAFQEELADLRLTSDERLALMQAFHEREQFYAAEHQRELAEIRRRETVESLADFGAAQASVETLRASEREREAREAITGETEEGIRVREKALDLAGEEIERTKEHIAALKERNKELLDTLSAVGELRDYRNTIRELFGREQPDSAQRREAERELQLAEDLYRQAVRNQLPREQLVELARELAELEERSLEVGGRGLRQDAQLVRAAERLYEQGAAEARTAAAEYRSNEEALAANVAALETMEGAAKTLTKEIEALKEKFSELNAEIGRMTFDDASGAFVDIAEAGENAREEYEAAITGIFSDINPDIDSGWIDRMVDRFVADLEAGNVEEALYRYGRDGGEALPAGVLQGILESPAPGTVGETLAESLGIDDVGAYLRERGLDGGVAYSEGFQESDTAEGDAEGKVDPVLEEIESSLESRLPGIGAQAGRGLMEAFASGILNNRQALLDAVEQVLSEVREYLPSSDAKRGPLSDLTHSGKMLTRTFLAGATAERGVLTKGMGKLLGGFLPAGAGAGRGRAGVALSRSAGPIVVNIDAHREQTTGPLGMSTRQLVRSVEREGRMRGLF